MTCGTNGNPKPSIIWYKNGRLFDDKNRLKVCINTQDNKMNKCTLGLQVMLIVEHYCGCEMWNSNKSAVHLLDFLSKCNVR